MCDKTQKKDREPRWRWIVDFVTCRLTKFSQHLKIQLCCIFLFFSLHFGRMRLSFFERNLRQAWQRNAPRKKQFGHEKVGSFGQKTMETHVPNLQN